MQAMYVHLHATYEDTSINNLTTSAVHMQYQYPFMIAKPKVCQ